MCDSPIRCPRCLTTNVKKYGLNFNREKQQYKCKACKYKFVDKGQEWFICRQKQELVKKLLVEPISLRGICRVLDLSLTWLLKFIEELYRHLPDDLNCHIPVRQVREGDRFYIKLIDSQADELWSFVKKRDYVYYLRLVMHSQTRQVIAFEVENQPKLYGKNYPCQFKNMAYSIPMIGIATKPSFQNSSTFTARKNSILTTWKGSIVPSGKDVPDS
jgi:insertion element IS1 protein InsB